MSFEPAHHVTVTNMNRFSRLQALTGEVDVYQDDPTEHSEDGHEEEREFVPFMFPNPAPKYVYEGTDSEDDEIIINRRPKKNASWLNQSEAVDDAPITFKTYSLELGQCAPTGEPFVPFPTVRKYPFTFVGTKNRPKVTKGYFDEGKVYNHGWDLFYLHHTPSDPIKKPIILVPTRQLEAFLRIINQNLKTNLSIPEGADSTFRVTFEDDTTPQPRYLGRVISQEAANDLQTKIPPANLIDMEKGVPGEQPTDRSLAAFQAKVDLMQQAAKANKAILKEKTKKQNAEKHRQWNQMTKRVQRYLGLRQLRHGHHAAIGAAEVGTELRWEDYDTAVNLAAAKLGPLVLDPNRPAPFVPEGDVVFVCIDVEAWERNNRFVTEIGVSTLDTRDITSLAPGEGGKNWMAQIRARHFRINEYKHLCNHEFVAGCPESFEFGESEFVNLRDVPYTVASCFKHPFSNPKADLSSPGNGPERNIILVGHDVRADIEFLQKSGYSVYNLKNLQEIVDTAAMYRYLKREPNPRSLAAVLSELGITGWNLHNAGNDAAYTLQAMIGIAYQQMQQKLEDKHKSEAVIAEEKRNRVEEQIEKAMELARIDAEDKQAGWSSAGEDSDGGDPVQPDATQFGKGKKDAKHQLAPIHEPAYNQRTEQRLGDRIWKSKSNQGSSALNKDLSENVVWK